MPDPTGTSLPPHAKFTLKLDKTIKNGTCPSVTKDVPCEFSYDYNFVTNEGLAHLLAVGGTPVNITLDAIGIYGEYAFMSDISSTTITVHGQPVVLNRICFVLKTTGARSAMIMFDKEGTCIQATSNWTDSDALRHAMSAGH